MYRLFKTSIFSHHGNWQNIWNVIRNPGRRQICMEKLCNRGLIRVQGKEASEFLQGLITNDMRHLDDGAQSMYTVFLNTKGRVMYDAIVYKPNDTFLIESDSVALPDLQKHLKMYRVRRKIDIDIVDNEYSVWVLYSQNEVHSPREEREQYAPHHGQNLSDDKFQKIILELHNKNTHTSRDPRLSELGYRVLAPPTTEINVAGNPSGINYRLLRYQLGVGEGVDDLPPGKCFPLEVNCDYLHGVSFHKGCYVGQELTARVHHTGTVRKRLMPLFLDSEPMDSFVQDSPIETTGDKTIAVGKLRGIEKKYGLGLLRISEAMAAKGLTTLRVTCRTLKPSWWPQAAPKERLTFTKEL